MTLDEQKHISGEFEAAMSGDSTADFSDEQEEIRFTAAAKAQQEARDRLNEELDEQKDKANENATKAGQGDGAGNPEVEGSSPSFDPLYGSRYRIYNTADDYITVKGLYKTDPRTRQKTIDPDRLRMALMNCIGDKGWTDGIAIYTGNRIDQQATSQAQNMLANDPVLRRFMEVRGISNVPCQCQLDPASPPKWLTSDADIAKHERRCEKEAKEGLKAQIKGLKEAEKKIPKRGLNTTADGVSLRDDLRARRAELEAQVPPNLAKRAFGVAASALGMGAAAVMADSAAANNAHAEATASNSAAGAETASPVTPEVDTPAAEPAVERSAPEPELYSPPSPGDMF